MKAVAEWLESHAHVPCAQRGEAAPLRPTPPGTKARGRRPGFARLRPFSLRTKGFIVFVLLAVYSVVLGSYVMYQKGVLLRQFGELQQIASTAAALGRFDADVLRIGSASTWASGAANSASRVSEARASLRALWNRYAGLTAAIPEVRLALTRLDGALARLSAGQSSAAVSGLRAEIVREHASLSTLAGRLGGREATLAQRYRERSDWVAGIALLLAGGGVTAFGLIIALFFTRLTDDLRLLDEHAKKIVAGNREDLVPVSRYDELGELMEAINHLSRGLAERDEQLEIERHKYFHREKMAAIGDLAAGIAHEIGNPISAIAGIAQSMRETQAEALLRVLPDRASQPELILAQTARLTAIAREISDFATPVPAEHQLLDLNDLIRSTCRFVRYDRRFRTIELAMDLDGQLPAVSAVGDRLVQVIMNLLINAVDALEGLQDRVPTIRIATSVQGGEVRMSIADNGCGMDDATLRHAFEAFFTTKRPGRGTGLGLALCYSIVAEHGGRIELESTPGAGTSARVVLPIVPPGTESARVQPWRAS